MSGGSVRACAPRSPTCRSTVLGGAARDQGVRAHQHHGGVRLRRADPGVLYPAARERHAGARPAPPLHHGLERRRARSRRGRGHAGHGGGVGAGGRRGGGSARGAADRAAQSPLVRHGRHHRQGQPDPRRPVRDDARIRGRRRGERQPLDARHRPSDPCAGDRSGRGVGGRRLDRLGGPGGLPCASVRRAPAPIRAPPATRAAAASRRSPTATWCSAISTRDRCWQATCRSIMRRPRRPWPAAGRAAGRGRAHGGGGRHRRRQSRDGGGAEDRVGAARSRCAPVRARGLRRGGPAACCRAGGRARHRRESSVRPFPAPSRRWGSSAPISSATTCAPSTPPPRAADPVALEAAFAALEKEGGAMLDRAGVRPGSRRFERSVDARYERQSYELSIAVRAWHAGCGGAGRDRRQLSRPPSGDLRSRQPQRAGATGQHSPHRRRRHSAAADARQAGAGRHRPDQGPARGVVPRRGPASAIVYDRGRDAGRAHGAGTGSDRVAGVHHSRSAGVAGWDGRGWLRAADAPAGSRRRGNEGRTAQGRSGQLRNRQEQFLQDRRGDAHRPRQDRVFADPEIGWRLLLRRVRCEGRDGGAGSRPADPFGLDARRRACRGRGFRHGRARRRRVHPQRSLFRRQPPARRQRGAAGVPRGPAAGLRLPARALARCRLGHARQLRRGHRDLRRGPAPAAAAARRQGVAQCRPREGDPRQRAHARRAQGRSRRAAWPRRCARPSG